MARSHEPRQLDAENVATPLQPKRLRIPCDGRNRRNTEMIEATYGPSSKGRSAKKRAVAAVHCLWWIGRTSIAGTSIDCWHRMAFADALSGLPNRRALDETLARIRGQYALAMIDIVGATRTGAVLTCSAQAQVLPQLPESFRAVARHESARLHCIWRTSAHRA